MVNLYISARAAWDRGSGQAGEPGLGGNGEVTEASAEGPSSCRRGVRIWEGDPAVQWGRPQQRGDQLDRGARSQENKEVETLSCFLGCAFFH